MNRERTKGLLMCYTGNGKGKTTAALGSLMRAYGRGLKVVMFQFIKKKGSEWGEHIAAKKLGAEIVPLGDGFMWRSEDIEKDRMLALDCWDVCQDAILNGDYDLIVLDEITYPVTFGWLKVDEVLSVIEQRPKWVHIIITGRDANEKLIEAADLVTQMTEVKHHFRSNVPQQPGIEW